MKNLLTFLVSLAIYFILYTSYLIPHTFAHMAGQPPFFKINGIYSDLYPVLSTSLNDFPLPQDLAHENYFTNQTLSFEIDTKALSAPEEIINKTKFTWDFGDGTKGEGLKNTHTYTKMGSYIIIIYVDNNIFQSVLLNILPDKNYQLPKSVIIINDKQSKDPLTDTLVFPPQKELSFDGSKSVSTSKVTEYFWDFGDESQSNKSIDKHTYKPGHYFVYPLLRIKTADGFIADTYVEVEVGGEQSVVGEKNVQNNQFPILPVVGTAVIILLLVGYILISKHRRQVRR